MRFVGFQKKKKKKKKKTWTFHVKAMRSKINFDEKATLFAKVTTPRRLHFIHGKVTHFMSQLRFI